MRVPITGVRDSSLIDRHWTAEFHPQMLHEVTEKCRLTYTYANGVRMTLGQGQTDITEGTTFIGIKGRVAVGRGKLTTEPAELAMSPLDAAELTQLYRSTDHTTSGRSTRTSGEVGPDD